MTKMRVNSKHGGRGPKPQSFGRWVLASAKRGAKRFRVICGDGEEKLVAHRNAPDSTKRIEAMSAQRVEALDDKDACLGEWVFPQELDAEYSEEPGYVKEPDDTEDERVLKTFAHLLADAHRTASRQLVEVVGIQSRHYAEERKQLQLAIQATERLAVRRSRWPIRMRVAEEEQNEPGGEGESNDEANDGLSALLENPILQPLLAKLIAKASDHVSEGVGLNGTAANDGKEKAT